MFESGLFCCWLPAMKTRLTVQCPLCNGTGWRPVEKDGWRAVERCSCQKVPHDSSWWMDRAKIPARFHDCDFDQFFDMSNSSLQFAILKARAFAEHYPLVERGLLFMGNPGVGKTHLAVAVMKHIMLQKGIDCLFCSFPEFLQQLQESYDPVSLRSKSEILQPILETEVVAIDDIGARRVTDWVEDTVTYILNHRYNHKKATLLTTNLPDSQESPGESSVARPTGARYRAVDTLTDRIGVRMYSRLFEMCEKISIHAKDFRQEVRVHQSQSRL